MASLKRTQWRFSGQRYMLEDAAEKEERGGLRRGEGVAQWRTGEGLALMSQAWEDALEETDYAMQAGRDGQEDEAARRASRLSLESTEAVRQDAEDLWAAEVQGVGLAEARCVARLLEGAAGNEETGGKGVCDERGGNEEVVGEVTTCRAPQS
ncbi:hypothetical protein CYMTET_52956 [Cymbomonas tetramitiformis]|uniref:Uncharacterized protein n=1 Tax=Cymbomonas tetramitiformis TaxID=36881 RepID=A0AAE0EQI9_9CHLO|nr:hypothetical protein CYMTET_52956 [Cymbomonas tetramitiformis]